MKLFSSKKYVQDYAGKDRLITSRINSAKKEGKEIGKEEIAQNLIGKLSIEEISNVTGLTIEKIKNLGINSK